MSVREEISTDNCSSVAAAAAGGVGEQWGLRDEERMGPALAVLASELHEGCHHKT